MKLKMRTVYFKVTDMPRAATFWHELLQQAPHKTFPNWHEFMCGNIRLGLLLNDFGDVITGSGCVPVFEMSAAEARHHAKRAEMLGAKMVMDALDNPRMKSIVLSDPCGNEFELSAFHDDGDQAQIAPV